MMQRRASNSKVVMVFANVESRLLQREFPSQNCRFQSLSRPEGGSSFPKTLPPKTLQPHLIKGPMSGQLDELSVSAHAKRSLPGRMSSGSLERFRLTVKTAMADRFRKDAKEEAKENKESICELLNSLIEEEVHKQEKLRALEQKSRDFFFARIEGGNRRGRGTAISPVQNLWFLVDSTEYIKLHSDIYGFRHVSGFRRDRMAKARATSTMISGLLKPPSVSLCSQHPHLLWRVL